MVTGQPNLAADDDRLMMAPAGWEGSPGRLAFLRNRALRDKEGDGGDGDEKKVGECLVVWGFIRIFAAPFAAKNGC